MNVSELSPDQKKRIASWVEEGLDLNALQKALNGEFGWKLTFMDTRFLILDLGLEIQTPKKQEAAPAPAESAPAPGITPPPARETAAPAAGKLELSVKEVTPPGMLISGVVKFPSGAWGSWFLDGQYRIGIDPDAASAEPTEQDMLLFQREIQPFLRNHLGGI